MGGGEKEEGEREGNCVLWSYPIPSLLEPGLLIF